MTTGVGASVHGVVANGVATYRSGADAALTDPGNMVGYRRAVSFWEQSNQFLEAPRVWEGDGRKVAMLFFQNSMPGFGGAHRPAADIVVTPKPEHGADGKIASMLWTSPGTLGAELQGELGVFPLMNYWGPMAGVKSSEWIGRAGAWVWEKCGPGLMLIYVPHLDYDLQRFGPGSEQAKKAVADLSAAVEPLLAAVEGERIVVVGEYGIDEVSRAIAPNRVLREAGLLTVGRNEEGPVIDYAGSGAWVMCDHQVGHVYLGAGADRVAVVRALTGAGVEVLEPVPISHRRAGEIQVQAPRGAWLDYRWWSDEADAPAWAGTVDIHRKPGYDPLELFFDPATRRIITDAGRIRGSHGRADGTPGVVVAEGVGEGAVLGAAEVARLLG